MSRGAMAWIDPRGRLLDFGTTHIQAIINNPIKFGTSTKAITTAHEKYGEKLGTEGKAREEIIKDVTKKGFIRIRFQRNYVSVTLADYDNMKSKKLLNQWAKEVTKDRTVDKYQDAKIYSVKSNKMTTKTLNDLAMGKHMYEGVDLSFVESVDDFGLDNMTFSEYISIS